MKDKPSNHPTPKELAMIEYYWATGNAYQSALSAGYAKTTANSKAHIKVCESWFQEELKKMDLERTAKVQLTREQTEGILSSIVTATVNDFEHITGVRIPNGAAPAVASIKVTTGKDGSKTTEVRMLNKIAAADILNKMSGHYSAADDGILLDDKGDLTDRQLEQILAGEATFDEGVFRLKKKGAA